MQRLVEAEGKAALLFTTITERQLLRPGVTEQQVSDEIFDLASELFGVTRHWHRRIVRSGSNTTESYKAHPPDRTLEDNDITFLDLGPIFEEWEADFGRTYVLGNDPLKCQLRDDLEPSWWEAKAHFDAHPDITGAQLFDVVVDIARREGWQLGADMAGHPVGEFPHDGLKPNTPVRRIWPADTGPMRGRDSQGRKLHWILELHFVNREREIGGFYEQLLTRG